MKLKYRYIGTGEVHLPNHQITVSKTGQIVEVDRKIRHPDFEYVEERGRKVTKK